jgi:hypothetical protein
MLEATVAAKIAPWQPWNPRSLPKIPGLDAAAVKALRNSLPGKLLGRTAAILAPGAIRQLCHEAAKSASRE